MSAERSADRDPVLVITGPTASGKSEVGLAVCRAVDGELVNADALQVYRGMDIGTAKTPPEQRHGVPHHLVDIRRPDEPYSVAAYVRDATACIRNIRQEGHTAVVCGGTGLYVQSLMEGWEYEEQPTDPDLRRQLELVAEREGTAPLMAQLEQQDPEAADRLDPRNTRRVVRALEMLLLTGRTMRERHAWSRRNGPVFPFLAFCLVPDRSLLYDRIDRRVDTMIRQGLIPEAMRVLEQGGETAAQAIGYKEWIPYFRGDADPETCAAEIRTATRRYAKRQMTWFRRMKNLEFIAHEDTEQTVTRILSRREELIR